ncbi:GNAT family N-acetyltransferase [Pedobacter polaris]|uniref:GNAT family N-acetyltransferase n=1 Tax=Pedobacter polaris TaxID=2571273 RepID=A0A4U1CTI4_9SPHI|nr:GNAT family N-acetyltransferase [Pedobacter polaris]TKC12093.1 GNAT family N-acetyltransferase [Pedobacter polaris]
MNRMIFQLLSINKTDAKQITALSIQLGYENDADEVYNRTSEIVKSNTDCVFVVKIEGQIVGWIHAFMTLRIESGIFLEIAGLVVDHEYYKMGIGKDLINAVKDWADARDIKKIKVRCNVIRAESHHFYKKIGFTQNKQQLVFEMNT